MGNDEVKGAEDGRINVLLLGMRGNNMPGGGLLADTIILVSLKPEENKVALKAFDDNEAFKEKLNYLIQKIFLVTINHHHLICL